MADPASVRAVAERAGDVDLLVNNAGVTGAGSLPGADPERARAELETNSWGPVALLRAFGFMDTDMVAHLDVPKVAPLDVARAILDGVADGAEEVLADAPSRALKAALSGPVKNLEI